MRAGDFLDQVLLADGGRRPYAWSADGLPAGLSFRTWGSVFGVLADASHDGSLVSLTVRDRRGNSAAREVPLQVEAEGMAALHSGLTELADEEYAVYREPAALGGLEFCLIPGGLFFVGYHPSDEREQYLLELHHAGYRIDPQLAVQEFPSASVHVDGFLMQRYEVTQAQFAAFVRATGHRPAGGAPGENRANHPAVGVSFEDAVAYCRYKTEHAAQAGLDLTYRLPTNWEWEKASKGPASGSPDDPHGAARLYPWGDTWGNGMLHDLNCQAAGTVEVNSYPGAQGPFGVFDLGGNVAEWIDGGQIESGTVYQHIRGASWRRAGQRYALTFFFGAELVEPAIYQDDLGFRCVLELSGRAAPQQAFVPLGGKDPFVDGRGERQYVGSFQMARFAVTNQEFAEFRPDHRYDARRAAHPVTGISHRDAMDFCRWKTEHDGRSFWLPTRAEWERACRGVQGRRYPWGTEYSKYRCNSLESGWGRTVAVWDLWEGATPEGVYNLCGNTFEWTREGEALGGSWCSTCKAFGAEPYQSASVDQDGRDDVGFRCVTY